MEKSIAFACAATTPATIAFASSPRVIDGLTRFLLLKPQEFPVDLELCMEDDGCRLEIRVFNPQDFAKYELIEAVFIAELIRTYSGKSEAKFSVSVSNALEGSVANLEGYFGKTPNFHNITSLFIDIETLALPLISANAKILDYLSDEKRNEITQDSLAQRVKAVLRQVLPSGRSQILDIAKFLGMSTRSLQRGLKMKVGHIMHYLPKRAMN